jgi:type II secretion system protein D
MEEQINISGTELTAVPDPRQQLAITVDSRTNSLIVSGTPAYLDLVQSVIDELDALDANERETFLYQLRNATASDVADVLGDFVETEQQKLIETIGVQQLGSAARLLEREITIRGDDKSNSVLVSASPRYMDRIKGVIQELDVDPPQVLIQVLLAEITLDGGVDWGVDMTKSGGSFTFNMGANGLAAFPSHLLGTLPSMTLGISDFSFVLRALENQGRLHILSNPSIMAANNEAANINVGEIIYVPVGSQTYETGSTNTPLEEKEIGVILSVVPSINPDGYVRMVVRPTFSKLAKEKDEPIHGVETPRIYQRTADTTVTVRDGQTIVIGGLISESYEYREDKVPLLGDIPLLGLLFKSEFEELIRTELVIVLTPHVITSPAAFDRIRELTKSQVENISLPSELLDQIEQGEIEGMGLFNKDGYKLQLRDLEEEIAPEAAKESESP